MSLQSWLSPLTQPRRRRALTAAKFDRRRASRRRVLFESLEGRRLLAANIIVNGSFEDGPAIGQYARLDPAPSMTSDDIPGWTVVTSDVAWLSDTNPWNILSQDGVRGLDLTGYDSQPYGGVQQSINTTPGQTYELSFYFNSWTAGSLITASVDGASQDITYGGGGTWELHTLEFTANSAGTEIVLSAPTQSPTAYIGLDNVSVIAIGNAPNSPPVAHAGGTYSVSEGGSVQLDGGQSSDPDQASNTLNYAWDLNGNGVFGEAGETGQTPNFSAALLDGFAGSSVSVALRVTDSFDEVDTTTTTIAINNVDPTATFNAPISIVYGNSINVSLNDSADASAVDAASLHYAFGYSTTNASPLSTFDYVGSGTTASHSVTSLNAGTYWVFARVIDKDGGYSEYSQEVTVQKATSTTNVTIAAGTFTYNGSAQTHATITVTGAGGLNLTPTADYVNNTNAGTATASYTFAGDDNHLGSNDSEDFIIAKADATVTVTGYGGTYDGAAHGATGSVAGVDALFAALGTSLDLGESFTNAPGGTANWTFEGGTNYNDQSGSVAIAIDRAMLTGDAVTQDALNMAKQGKLKITVSNVAGLVNGDTLADFLSDAEYYITVGDNRYEFVPTSVTSSGDSLTVEYSLKNPDLASSLAAELEDNTSGATAVSSGFSIESLNYLFIDDYLTRLFSTAK